MNSIIPHILLEGAYVNKIVLKRFHESGFETTLSGVPGSEACIVYKELSVSGKNEYDLTDELQGAYKELRDVTGDILKDDTLNDYSPGVLVGKEIRGRLENGRPTGYFVELDGDNPIVHSLENMTFEDIPLLVGYGSLLSPGELACNTEGDGSLRNTLSPEDKIKLAEERKILENLGYYLLEDTQLVFSRGPTAKRYGNTQEARNAYCVLNSMPQAGALAPVVIFDPSQLTDDARTYFARENSDEMEYNRRAIRLSDAEHRGGKKLEGEKAWLLESPLITDVDGKLEVIAARPNAMISERYTGMITNGLAGAESVVRGFSTLYVDNVIQADGAPLSQNPAFMRELNTKIMEMRAKESGYTLTDETGESKRNQGVV